MDALAAVLADEPSSGMAKAERAPGSEAFHEAARSEGVRQLTLGLVHEMNNVLGGIAVLSEIYQDRSDDDGLGEGLALIHKSTGRLQGLIGQLKTLNGPTTEEPVYLNLPEAVRALLEMFAPLLPKNLTVETAFPMEELAVHLDPARLRRMLLNLTLNLRDDLNRHPEAPGTLRVGVRHRGNTAEVILSTRSGIDERTPCSADAQARLDDARDGLLEMGGTLIALSHREFILLLPLVA